MEVLRHPHAGPWNYDNGTEGLKLTQLGERVTRVVIDVSSYLWSPSNIYP